MSKEKIHADKLKTRISDLTSTISSKQIEYEETKSRYHDLVKANARFYESATKFRETYMKVDSLNGRKASWEEELRGCACSYIGLLSLRFMGMLGTNI